MAMVGLMHYEKILVSNLANGNRFETYAIPAPAGSGTIGLNGPAVYLGKPGDLLVIMSFIQLNVKEARKWVPKVLVLGEHNQKIIKLLDSETNKLF